MSATTAGVPDLRVRECTVTVRRRDGWSWGDPQRYVDLVVPALEELLRRLMEEAALPVGVDCRVTTPVTLELGPDGQPTFASRRALLAAIREAGRQATPTEWSPTQNGEQPDAPERSISGTTSDDLRPIETMVSALAAWSRSGRLAAVVRTWSPALLAAWVARVEELARSPRPGAPAVSAPAVEAIAEAVVASSWPAGDRPGAEQRAEELVVLLGAVVVAAHGILPDTDTLELVLRRTVGRPAATPVPLPTAAAAPAVTSVHPVSGSATPDLGVPASDTPLVLPGLPFLVLVQLARLGYLEPALATLVACDAPPAALVAAVAGACLDPPGRGRRRESFDRTAVGMAAGLEEDEIDDVLGRLAAEEQAVEPGWRSALIELYVAGRSRDDELVVTELGAERLCGEAPGLLPIAWVPAEQLDEVLDQLGRPVVRVDPLLAPLAEELAPRRALPGLVAPALERQVATVVGSALGSLAVELWGGDADALTALDRLGDLEVQVTQGERLRIGIPRGQRWLDLQRAGLLEPWWVPGAAGSPWEVGTW